MGAVMMSHEMKPPGAPRVSSPLAGLVRDLGAAIAAGLTPHYLRCVLRLRSRAVMDSIHSLAQFTCELEADAAADTAVGNLIRSGGGSNGDLVLTSAQRKVVLFSSLMRQVTQAVLASTGDEDLRVVDVRASRN